jgi:hypothetical protein
MYFIFVSSISAPDDVLLPFVESFFFFFFFPPPPQPPQLQGHAPQVISGRPTRPTDGRSCRRLRKKGSRRMWQRWKRIIEHVFIMP